MVFHPDYPIVCHGHVLLEMTCKMTNLRIFVLLVVGSYHIGHFSIFIFWLAARANLS